MTQTIPVIALTGGPCGGKSTILNILRQRLEDLGYAVFVVPETATDFINSGITPERLDSWKFQKQLLQHLIEREDRWIEAAQEADARQKKIVICDRGAPDSAAYMSSSAWAALLDKLGYSMVDLRDKRYAGAIFLRSVACDASHIYTRTNNLARKESLEEAEALDALTLSAWIGCPHLSVIDNSTDLDGKAFRTMQAVSRILGIPEPLEIERKYVVQGFDPASLPEHAQPVHIVQQYLGGMASDTVERVRARGQNGSYTYYHTIKSIVRDGVRTETERQIDRDAYEDLLKRADGTCFPVDKTRYCFVWENQYFELDCFNSPPGLMLLEIELTHEHQTVTLPPFLEGKVTDVTGMPHYDNFAIAQRRVA